MKTKMYEIQVPDNLNDKYFDIGKSDLGYSDYCAGYKIKDGEFLYGYTNSAGDIFVTARFFNEINDNHDSLTYYAKVKNNLRTTDNIVFAHRKHPTKPNMRQITYFIGNFITNNPIHWID